MFNFSSMLGPDPQETAYAQGAAAGVIAVKLILEKLTEEYPDEPDAFFEGLFDAIRTEI
jgi:hypothetical protein